MAPRFDQRRRRRRIKKRELQPSRESVGISAVGHRNWADLPALPLVFILDRLFLFGDLFAFGGVCSSWRSLFLNSAGKDALRCRPPLLLRPISKLGRPTPRTWKYNLNWKKPARCHLTYPSLADPPPVPYRCMISSSALSSCFCIGSSFGNLILANRCRQIIIADVFTGDEIMSPELPHNALSYHNGFLTAPPSSPDCRLILSDLTVSSLLMWRVGAHDWSEHLRLPPIRQLLLVKRRVFAFDFSGQIHTLHFSPRLSFEPLEGTGPPPSSINLFAQLVECGDELLYVSLNYSTDDMSKLKFTIFRLDFSKKVWVEVNDLGGWSLFIDVGGRCHLSSCISSTGWGGRSNCIYFAGSESDSWSVYHLDEVLLLDNILSGSPFFLANTNPFWPIWVYPSLFSK